MPDGTTRFAGTFINRAKGYKCQGTPYQAYDGQLSGRSVTFKVYFSACSTFTTWAGRFRGKKLNLPWNLVYFVNGQPNYLKGIDIFHRIH
jgi:hypothetical protein